MSTGTDAAPGYKRKLIEVALPLEDINREAAREKSIRHGHPSTLHLWWARRPLAAARAVLFAPLVDDPSAHPDRFPTPEAEQAERERLFAIIRELVKWENTTNETVLAAARKEIWDSCDGNPPPILDPFAGGGSIPFEAQRLGLEAHASDLNPVAVLINKALIEIPPKWAGKPPVHPDAKQQLRWRGAEGLAEDIRCYGKWMHDEAERRVGHLYPKAKLDDGTMATVIAWIWARTVTCPNPACRGTMPLVRSFWLGKKKGKERYVDPVPSGKRVGFEIHGPRGTPREGTVSRTGAECLLCGAAVPLVYIRGEAKAGRMGAQLMAIAAEGPRTRYYLPPNLDSRCRNSVEVWVARRPRGGSWRCLAGQWSAGWESEAQGPAVPPGDGEFEVGEAGVDEDGVVAAQGEVGGDAVGGDLQGAGVVEEVPPDRVGGGAGVAGQVAGEQAVEVAGDDGEGGVEVDVERDGR